MTTKKTTTKAKKNKDKNAKVKVYKLAVPITVNGEKIKELTIRKPKGKDFRKIQDVESPFGVMMDLIAHLAKVPPSAIDNMDGGDVAGMFEEVGDFLGLSRLTGK